MRLLVPGGRQRHRVSIPPGCICPFRRSIVPLYRLLPPLPGSQRSGSKSRPTFPSLFQNRNAGTRVAKSSGMLAWQMLPDLTRVKVVSFAAAPRLAGGAFAKNSFSSSIRLWVSRRSGALLLDRTVTCICGCGRALRSQGRRRTSIRRSAGRFLLPAQPATETNASPARAIIIILENRLIITSFLLPVW
jgi:hypothetical protein